MLLETKALSYAYPHGQAVLKQVNLQLAAGEVLVLLGPNGVGKSTLLNCLTGSLTPTSGTVLLNQQPVAALPAQQRTRQLAWVAQATNLTASLPVLDYVLLGRVGYHGPFAQPNREDQQLATAALEQVGLANFAKRPVSRLSGGQKQLVVIARALAQQAQLLILDEPTAALDLANQALVLAMVAQLKQSGHTVVMTSHDPNHAAWADQVGLLGQTGYQQEPAGALSAAQLCALYQAPVTAAKTADQTYFTLKGACS